MTSERKTHLRVLYTINASPQYILAKSHTRVTVSVISPAEDSGNRVTPDASNSQLLYANVLLKTCLNTIRRSSPELTYDSNRDFSIYVLDPLESNSAPAPVQISNTDGSSSSSNNGVPGTEQPRGVAVGLGLMSWALAADDSDAMTVVGTLVKQTNGQEALEVIFALRETIAMQKPTWNIQPGSSQPPSSQESVGSTVDVMQYLPSSQSSSSSYHTQSLASTSVQTRSSTADLTRETLASIQMRTKTKVKPPKPPKPVRQSNIPVTESDKLMNADTYIGPLKKKGRPKTAGVESKPAIIRTNAQASGSRSVSGYSSSQPKEFIIIDGSDSDAAATPTTATFSTSTHPSQPTQGQAKKKRTTQYPKSAPFTTEPLVRRIPNPESTISQVEVKVEQREEPNLLDILTYLSAASSSEPSPQNTALLAALSTIDSADSKEASPEANAPNPVLISALKQLLSVYAQQPSNPEPVRPAPTNLVNPEPTKTHRHSSSVSQDDGIVILDKENVNPVAYRKRAGKDPQPLKPLHSSPTPVSSSAIISSTQSSHQDRHIQSLGPSARSNETPSTRPSFNEPVLGSSSGKIVRKRTLSDFMDERENGRSKGKGKERERIEKRDGHRHAHSQRVPKTPAADALRHYPRLLNFNQPRTEQPSSYYREPLECMTMTSPARAKSNVDEKPVEREDSVASGSGSQSSSSKSQSSSPARLPRVSASSPVRRPQHEARKKYVVPEWARTSTSTQPRLSEEAQRALEEAEERKKQERSAARKKLPSMQAKLKNNNAGALSKADARDNHLVKPLAPPPPPKFDAPRAPVTANSDRPMIAAADIAFPFISSTRSLSPPPQPNVIPRTPKTPCRDRQLPRATPGGQNDSLFTPVMGSGSLFGSAHSHSLRTPLLPSVLTSPLGNRKKAKLSPTRSSLTGKPFSLFGSWASSSSAPTSSDSKNMEEETPSKSLGLELEDALDDSECPPSSLPIASSDIDVDESHPQPSQEADLDDSEQPPVRQHWAGLPPSSPPAPSSPMLLPESLDNDIPTDDEMDEIPIATSDSETDTEMTSCDTNTASPNAESPVYFNDNSHSDFSAFFTQTEFAATGEHANSSDLFEQFTTINEQNSDLFSGMDEINMDAEIAAMFQDGLENIDFTEFWETFKPMVSDSTQVPQDHSNQSGRGGFEVGPGDSLASFAEIDHVKLADDMQSLLSGCLM
ncbi:hypothetical protein GALMADRAFT_542740 [Galerina marginata CBS 339.88]|uniref:Uncharacterized protein n=1 Tax=Galerina marginata (strain CBS 339.88) TaxID=685588 RepID=A0A067SYW0_GALM3|nr:hypothetical protein GALMADRAFT_542740 [Galerina marginata CBS 339.88]